MTAPRSSLAGVAGSCREPDPRAARRAAHDAWHASGIVLINPEWLKGWADRKSAEMLAEKLFGKRKEPK